jgi:hypothetical protein
MEIIPFTSDPAQEFVCQFDGDAYLLACRYNERSESWTMDITRESDQVLLLAGVPMLLGQDVLAPYALGIGGLTLTDLANTDVDPGPEDDLGTRVIVTRFSPAEQALIREALAALHLPAVVPPPGAAGGGSGGDVDTGGSGGGSSGGSGGTGGGSVSTGAVVPLYGPGPYTSDLGSEEMLTTAEAAANLANLPSTVHFDVSFYAQSISGTATIRMYVGGTPQTADGTLRASVTVPAGSLGITGFSGSFANPGGRQPVKFTIQSSGAGVVATVANLVGSLS